MTEFIQLRVADERYALDVAQALEVGASGDITRVPGAPPAVLGVCNLRGQVLPVVDLAAALGVPSDGGEPARYFVVVDAAGRRAALAIDEVLAVGVLDGPVDPADDGAIRGRIVAGGELFGLLDAERLLGTLARAA